MTAQPDFFALAESLKPRHEPNAQPFTSTPGRDVSAYAAKALQGELDNVRNAPQGTRNAALNNAAVKLGHLIAAGALDHNTVRDALGHADTRPGDRGGVAWATIDSGLNFGMKEAKRIPDRERPPWLEPLNDSDPFASAGPAKSPATAGIPSSQHEGAPPSASDTAAPDAAISESDKRSALIRKNWPIINWAELWLDKSETEWIIEPLLPARRLIALYSPPKVGKSLLLLELALNIARGTTVLGTKPNRPYRVLYVDFENDPQGDVLPRLRNMGADPSQLGNLSYLSFPTLAGLDSERGSLELMAAVVEYGAEVVVIDTVSRSVKGEENENDTWLNFYNYTGLKLKQNGIALIRLDHTGKDEEKGQRGGSAKGGDVDAVWRLQRLTNGSDGNPETFRLICEMNRFPILAAEKVLTIERLEGPLRHHVRPGGAQDNIVEAIVAYLESNDVPLKAGRDTIPLAELKVHVPGASQRTLQKAIDQRRALSAGWDDG